MNILLAIEGFVYHQDGHAWMASYNISVETVKIEISESLISM